jgi:hypothetical protein
MLKDKKIVRRLAWLLCLSLIVSLVPVGMWSTPVYAVTDGTVVFTEGVEESTFWKRWTKTGSALAWPDADYQFEGDRVLLLQTPNDTATSPAIAVTPGKEYTLSYYTKQHTAPAGAAGPGSVQIRFYNASGALISGATAKAANPMTVKAKTVKAKAKKKTIIKKAKAFTVKKAQGKVTFKKTSGNKKITVSKAGNVTVKKGLKKGKTYKVKVKVKAAGNDNYKSAAKTVTLKVKVN